VLRSSGPKRDEVIGDWKKLHNKERYTDTSANIIRIIKPKEGKWAGH
jgi:hypothetical protein